MPTTVQNPYISIAEAEIRSLLDSIFQAHHDKDAEAIAAPYAPNAAIFDLPPPLAHPGVTVERKEPWLDSWETPIDLEFRNLKITISCDHAFGHGFLGMQGTKRGPDIPSTSRCEQRTALHTAATAGASCTSILPCRFYMDDSLRPAFDQQ
jgi:ketosteroid isomerase-like protein